jgi:hypothetical protein
MPTWLVENPTPVYLILGIAALVLLVRWWTTRQKKFVIGLGVVAVLAALVWLLDYLVVTDSEQIVRNVEAMAQAVNDHDMDRAFSYLSKDFDYRGHDKASFRQKADSLQQNYDVRSVTVWDFDTEDVSREKKSGKAKFSVKVKGNWGAEEAYYRCRAEFVLEDGQWRLKTFELHLPMGNEPFYLP